MIKTKEIDKYIHNVLLKRKTCELTEEDLLLVKRIVLSGVNYDNEKIEYDFRDFSQLSNLESCTMELFDIDDEFIDGINSTEKLCYLTLSHCKILSDENIDVELKNLVISYCEGNVAKMLKYPESIETLQLLEVGEVDMSELVKFKNLRSLYIYNSEIKNMNEIKCFDKLFDLRLDGSKMDDESVLNELDKNIKIHRTDVFLPVG